MNELDISWSREAYENLTSEAIENARRKGINLSSLYIIEVKSEGDGNGNRDRGKNGEREKSRGRKKIIFGCRFSCETDGVFQALATLKGILRDNFGCECEIFIDAYSEVNYVMEKMRNYIRSHGGDVEVVDVKENEGIVVVSMKGACSLCPSAVATMKAGIRRSPLTVSSVGAKGGTC